MKKLLYKKVTQYTLCYITKGMGKGENMSTGISIREIKNEYLQKLAEEVDVSKNNYIDGNEISVFIEKAQEQKDKYSQKDFAEVMGLFRIYEKPELSWEEIGEIGINRGKELVKGMFCDEEGFSLKRTLTTLGTGAAFAAISAVSAPVALICGAALGAYTVFSGTAKIIEGKKAYDNAKTHEEAVQAMENAMDGGIETGLSILALFGIRQCANKMSINAKSGIKIPPEQQAYRQPKSRQTQTKPAENTGANNAENLTANRTDRTVETKVDAHKRTVQKSTKYKDGHTVEKFYNKSGAITKEIRTDVNGKKMTVEYKYDKDGFNVISKTETYDAGYIFETNPMRIYPKGMMKETTFEKGLRKEVCTDGETLTTNWYDRQSNIVKQELSTPDRYGRIKYEKTKNGEIETFADGRVVEKRYHRDTYDEITTYPDGTKKTRTLETVKIIW